MILMKVINTKYHWIQNDINLDFEDRFQHALVHEIAEAEKSRHFYIMWGSGL